MRTLFLAATLLCAHALAADYRIDPGASVRNGMLTVEPRVQGPASGDARLGSGGAARLAITSVNVSPQDRYAIQVKLFDGGRVVAEKTVRYPD